MRTKLGDKLTDIRIEKGHTLRKMAEKLEVSSAFLSAVENGKKKMPASWVKKLKEEYNISSDECEKIKELSMESNKMVSINIENAKNCNKELAVSFARRFNDIDEKTCKEIMELLRRRS